MSAPTPGPWATSRDAVPADHVQITVYDEKDGRRVATVFLSEANAALIAAAPDMLAACALALEKCGFPVGACKARAALAAAIEKAAPRA